MVFDATSGGVPNQLPTTEDGADKSVTVNTTVTIIGRGSCSDCDGAIAGYTWSG